MRGLDNFETGKKTTGGNRNVVPTENATNFMDHKKKKKSSEIVLREADTTRSLIKRISKRQATFLWPCDEKRETRTSCD